MGLDIEAVFSAAPTPLVLLDRDLRITWANDEYLRVTMRDREDIVGRIISEAFEAAPESESEQMLQASFRRVLESCEIDHLPLIPYPITRPDGTLEERFWSATHTPILDDDGSVKYILQNTNDVTAILRGNSGSARDLANHSTILKRAEQVAQRNLELDAATEFFQSVFHQAPSLIAISTGPEHMFRIANEVYHKTVGKTDLVGRTVREAFPEVEGQGFFELLDQVYETGVPVAQHAAPVELRREGRNQTEQFYFDFVYQPLFDGSGKTVGIFCQGHDVTAQQLAEQSLKRTEERFRSMAQTMPAHVWTADATGAIDWLSNQILEYSGLPAEEILGDKWSSLLHPEDLPEVAERWQSSIMGGQPYEAEFRLRRHDGVYRWQLVRAVPLRDDSGEIVSWTGTNTDIEDRKVIEAALADLNATLEARVDERNRELEEVSATLRQSQKMEAIGNLAGGIAHDFNNLLQTITGSLQLAERHMEPDSPEARRIDLAKKAVERGAVLASQLLSFGRRQPLEPRAVNAGRQLREMLPILGSAVGEGVTIETRIAPDLWNTLADPLNVENAMLNLAVNARDAMSGRGRLIVSLANTELGQSRTQRHMDFSPGEYVMISITDTGCGMSPEVVSHVFEPFYTTKPEGRGTGLGLAMVYGFIKQSNGHVAIESEPGVGTTVKLYLPRTELPEVLPTEIPDIEVIGGNETILLVEDDDAVRETSADLLDDLGYKVILAEDADRAMDIIESERHFDMLLTDVVMPGRLSSREVALEAMRLRPGLKVLFSSGYARDVIVHEGRLDEGVQLLSKPYDRDALGRKVREMLMQPSAVEEPEERSLSGLRILLCEDDAIIRMDLSDMLASQGCNVNAVGSGRAALDFLQESEIDLLMTDVGLPDMAGTDLAREALVHHPNLPVLFATGHQTVAGASEMARARVITKPFDEKSLFEAMGALMTD